MQRGFTFVEVLLSIGMLAVIAGISVPVFQSFQVRNDLDDIAISVVQTLRRAQVLSQAVDGDTTWGVRVESGLVALFKGATYATRDTGFDETFDIPGSLVPSGLQEVVFGKLTGVPQGAGSITLTSNANETRIITINAKGTLSY